MNFLKSVISLIVVFSLVLVCGLTAQDTTVTIVPVQPFPTGGGVTGIIQWLITFWNIVVDNLLIIVFALEAVLSLIPTKKNFSIFQKIRELLDKLRLFRNNRSDGGKFIAESKEVE